MEFPTQALVGYNMNYELLSKMGWRLLDFKYYQPPLSIYSTGPQHYLLLALLTPNIPKQVTKTGMCIFTFTLFNVIKQMLFRSSTVFHANRPFEKLCMATLAWRVYTSRQNPTYKRCLFPVNDDSTQRVRASYALGTTVECWNIACGQIITAWIAVIVLIMHS